MCSALGDVRFVPKADIDEVHGPGITLVYILRRFDVSAKFSVHRNAYKSAAPKAGARCLLAPSISQQPSLGAL